jgi:tryptophan synthase beta subunit
VIKEAAPLSGKLVLVNLSGRGDKDLGILEAHEPDR